MKKIKSLLDQFEQLQTNSEQGQVISNENLKNLKGGDWGFFGYFNNNSWGCTFCNPDDDSSFPPT